MPVYDFVCNGECQGEREAYVPLTTSEAPSCCGLPMDKVFRPRRSFHKSVFPYVTTHITGKPIDILSESHLQSLCKQHNVRSRPDAAFLDENESGRGMPGQW